MLKAYGEHGGRVRKPLRTAGGVLCIGAEIAPETAEKWPLKNRMAMDRTETVFWYPAPIASALDQQPADAMSPPGDAGLPPGQDGAGGVPDLLGAAQEGAQRTDGDNGVGSDASGSNSDGQESAPADLPRIDSETAERDELRAWLIKAGDEPAPALGTEKLRLRVREKLAASAAEPKKEG